MVVGPRAGVDFGYLLYADQAGLPFKRYKGGNPASCKCA